MCAGREKATDDSEYIQFNPLTDMTSRLFRRAVEERRAVLQAKDKFRSQFVLCFTGVRVTRPILLNACSPLVTNRLIRLLKRSSPQREAPLRVDAVHLCLSVCRQMFSSKNTHQRPVYQSPFVVLKGLI